MKILSKQLALKKVARIRDRVTATVRHEYEHKAASCLTCMTPGACCVDAHFVNIRISRLEAVAINEAINALPPETAANVRNRIDHAIIEYDLKPDATHANKFACPLFERGTGCLVHDTAKPIPCIVHACYDSADDLPPVGLADEAEIAIDRLNTLTYGRPQPLLPLPLAIKTNAKP